MWKIKTKVVPVITGATVTIYKSFRKYRRNLPGKHEIRELQKTAILAPRTQTSETTNVKVQKSVMENNIACTVCINNRIGTKLYVLKTWFVSGI